MEDFLLWIHRRIQRNSLQLFLILYKITEHRLSLLCTRQFMQRGKVDMIYYHGIATNLRSWFQGDIGSDEAADLLAGKDVGTFLLRFSSSQPGIMVLLS